MIALGGDGTVNEVVNGLLADGPSPDLPASPCVPGGSANVFARALGLPNDPLAATGRSWSALRAGRHADVGLGDGAAPRRRPTATSPSARASGCDAEVVRGWSSARLAGASAYTGALRPDGGAPVLHADRPAAPGAARWSGRAAAVDRALPGDRLEHLAVDVPGPRPVYPSPQARFDTASTCSGCVG